VKGGTDLDSGLKAMFQLESGVNAAGGTVPDGNGGNATGQVFSNARDMYVGLSGGFGSVTAGRQGGANQWVYDSNLFSDQLGDAGNFNSGAGVGGRLDKVLIYQTPDISGFKAGLTIIPASSLDSSTTTTVYTTPAPPTVVATTTTTTTNGKNSGGIKLDYGNAGIGGHFAYFKVGTTTATVDTDHKNMSVAGSFDFGSGMVTAQYVKSTTDVTGAASTTRNVYNIGGKFNVSSNSAVKAQYSKAGASTGSTTDGASMFAVGYDYNLSKSVGMYVVYAATSNDANGTYTVDDWGHGGKAGGGAIPGEDPKGFGVGLTYNF
jgi:predicted porin